MKQVNRFISFLLIFSCLTRALNIKIVVVVLLYFHIINGNSKTTALGLRSMNVRSTINMSFKVRDPALVA